MAKKKTLAPVSRKALVGRINRNLRKRDEMLRACRPGSRSYHDLGDYYIVNFSRNFVVSKNVDLEDFGREIEVLQKWEHFDASSEKGQA
jgi:hypothetical protein